MSKDDVITQEEIDRLLENIRSPYKTKNKEYQKQDKKNRKRIIPVILESPYAADTEEGIKANIQYARKCMRDCFTRGEAPFASHLLYTQPGILDDNIPEERKKGIEAGLVWGKFAEKTVVYCDLGISEGMQKGINRAKKEGRPVENRYILGTKTGTK